MKPSTIIAPGARILVRDAEWLVRRVDNTSTNGQAITVTGISELVKDKESIFLTEVEPSIEILDPVDTKLIQDTSSNFQASILYIESQLRHGRPTEEKLYVGHKGVMDPVPYQWNPALQALQQPRQRILIADGVGLGKTLEAGILVSELIKRGQGKRILVVAVKSMLTQFQQEFWNRFTIPLTRLDSVGLQRVRSRIPTNHNPFYYYDKSIISIDTLKQDAEYRTYLENAYWDIIIIDEAHNVADRGQGGSLRARLAHLLSQKSDTLIMLSATPHDGRAKSFASLMNMLDPTAISNPEEYTKEDIKGLCVRRFKKDIQNQVKKAFQKRHISISRSTASPAEENAYESLTELQFTRIDKRKGAARLFKTTLEKSLFSSPAACIKTIENRIRTLKNDGDPSYLSDIEGLEELAQKVSSVSKNDFSKYQSLLEVIKKEYQWTGAKDKDRLVIFTERIETLKFLQKNLEGDLSLRSNQIETLDGTMLDVVQQKIVENFGKEKEKVRLLIASDVASEGINLHYLCHRMIHFDIPWSLMVFSQRNGRIDRYGQDQEPFIKYLITESINEKIRGDSRIQEVLVQKEEQAYKNIGKIGDPAFFMGVHDVEKEEDITANAIENGMSPDEFDKFLDSSEDPLADLLGETKAVQEEDKGSVTQQSSTLFSDDFSYLKAALSFIRTKQPLQAEYYPAEQRIDLTAPEELKYRYRFLPPEIFPQNSLFVLSADRDVMKAEIKRSRKDGEVNVQYLWEQHPVMDWVNDKLTTAFGRHEAPVLALTNNLSQNETIFVLSGLIPNRKGHPLVQRWFGIIFYDDKFQSVESFESIISRTGIGKTSLPNREASINVPFLKSLLPEAIQKAQTWMESERNEFEEHINVKLNEQLNRLDSLKNKRFCQLEFDFGDKGQTGEATQRKKEQEKRTVGQIFDDYLQWIEDTMTTEKTPYLQVIAVLKGGN